MGRKVKFPPSVLAHKPSGRDRVRWAGKEYWLGPSGSDESRREYARLVKLFAEQPDAAPAPKPPDAARITVNEAVAIWDEKGSAAHSAKEVKSYRRALLVVCRVAGRDKLADFGRASLKAVQEAMMSGSWMKDKERARLERLGRPADWCAAVVNRQIVRVRTVWRWLADEGIASEESVGKLCLLKGVKKTDRRARHRPKVRPATQADLDAVSALIRSSGVRALLAAQWWTAARSGELRGMRAGDLDTSGEVWLYRPRSHKNAWREQDRTIAIGPEGQKVIAPKLAGKRGSAHVFVNRKGKPYTAEAYARIVNRAAHKAGRPWFRPLCLRHGARLRVTRAMSLDHARSVLGHVCLSTTLNYAASQDVQSAVAAALVCG